MFKHENPAVVQFCFNYYDITNYLFECMFFSFCDILASRYCSMLVSEDGAKLLEELVDTSTTVLKVRQLAKSVLDMIDSELGSNWRQ